MSCARVAVDMTVRQKAKLLVPEARSEWDAEHPLLRTFHYRIPPHLESKLAIGQVVWVPFGSKLTHGVVVALDEVAPVPDLRDISRVIDERPMLTLIQIALARWMSRYYLCPLFDTLSLMLPLGILRASRKVVSATEKQAPPDLPPCQQEALAALRGEGTLPLSQATKRFGRATIRALIEGGWAEQWDEIPKPRVRPKTARFIRLLADPAGVTETPPVQTRRVAAAKAMLETLAKRNGWMPLSELRQAQKFSRVTLDELAEKGLVAIEERVVWRDPLAGKEFVLTSPPRFTLAQEQAWQAIRRAMAAGTPRVFLIHGVTGSGKTEIYLRAVLETLQMGRQAIILVPEISLTPQTIRRFAARFPGRLAVIHSRLSLGERYDEWRRIRDGLADVVIGPRSALFSPLPRLGLIVLDEEHENSYKQGPIPGQQVPAYHARDVAIEMGRLAGAQVILGSATPSLEAYYRTQQGQITLLQMPQRVMGHRRQWEEQRARYQAEGARHRGRPITGEYADAQYMDLPPIQVVDLRQELRAGNRSIFSRALMAALRETLDAEEQAILFLNRRGASTFILCRDCGLVIKCPQCEIPLTYHSAGEQLLCHRCGHRQPSPEVCPTCGGKRIRFFGIGTQKVEEVAREMFPRARILRWDSDTAKTREAHDALLERFAKHEADILIGTQMVAKGLDLPLVTLVGVVTADTALHLPDFRSSERTFQLLEQVSGRAGRSILGGRVIIQTYTPAHYAIQATSRHDYEGFYRRELAFRRIQGYPPVNRLTRLVYADEREDRVRHETERMARLLQEKAERFGLHDLDLIGPSPCYFSIWQGRYRWQILVRGADLHILLEAVPFPPGWYVDVDPDSVL